MRTQEFFDLSHGKYLVVYYGLFQDKPNNKRAFYFLPTNEQVRELFGFHVL